MKNANQKTNIQEQLARKIVKRMTVRGTVLTAIGAVCWSVSTSCSKILQNNGFSPQWLASTRILIAGAILTIIGVSQNPKAVKELFRTKKDIFALIMYGVFGMMMAQYTSILTVGASNPATATALQYTGPVMIVIIVCIMSKRLPTLIETAAIILAVGGTFLLATHGNLGELSISTEALIFGFLSALGLVLYSLIPSKIIPKYGSITITGLGMLCGGVVLLFIARPWNYSVHFEMKTILAYIGLAVVGTALGYTLYMQGVSDIGSVKASMISSIEPLTTTLFSIFIGTKFFAADYIGIACIAITVFILSLPPKKLKISFRPHGAHRRDKETTKEDDHEKQSIV